LIPHSGESEVVPYRTSPKIHYPTTSSRGHNPKGFYD